MPPGTLWCRIYVLAPSSSRSNSSRFAFRLVMTLPTWPAKPSRASQPPNYRPQGRGISRASSHTPRTTRWCVSSQQPPTTATLHPQPHPPSATPFPDSSSSSSSAGDNYGTGQLAPGWRPASTRLAQPWRSQPRGLFFPRFSAPAHFTFFPPVASHNEASVSPRP